MRIISIVGALVAGLVAAAPVSAATVSPPGVRSPQVAVNAKGATVVAWERLRKGSIAVEVRRGGSPQTLGRTQRLTTRGFQPRVAVGSDGTMAVQWVEFGARGVRLLRVAVARPGHRFGKSQLIDRRRANLGPVGVAVQPRGRVVAIWQRQGNKLGFAFAGRGRVFGKPRDLTTIGPLVGGSIALDPRDGTVVVAYGTPLVTTPPTNQQAAARTLSRTATKFSAPVVLAPAEPSLGAVIEAYPWAVSGPAGTGVAYTVAGDPYTLNIARRNADDSWATPERIAVADYGEGVFPQGLRATLPADGAAAAAWSIVTEAPGGLGGVISSQAVTSVAAPGSPFGPAQALTPENERYGFPALAAAGGEAFIAAAKAHGPVLLATRSPGAATFATTETLTTRGDGDVLLASGGTHVLAFYQRRDRLRMRVVR